MTALTTPVSPVGVAQPGSSAHAAVRHPRSVQTPDPSDPTAQDPAQDPADDPEALDAYRRLHREDS